MLAKKKLSTFSNDTTSTSKVCLVTGFVLELNVSHVAVRFLVLPPKLKNIYLFVNNVTYERVKLDDNSQNNKLNTIVKLKKLPVCFQLMCRNHQSMTHDSY